MRKIRLPKDISLGETTNMTTNDLCKLKQSNLQQIIMHTSQFGYCLQMDYSLSLTCMQCMDGTSTLNNGRQSMDDCGQFLFVYLFLYEVHY